MGKKSRKRAKPAPPSQEQRLEELLAGVEEYASPYLELDPEEEPRLYGYSKKLMDTTAELRCAAATNDICRVFTLAMNTQYFLDRILYDRWRDAKYAAKVQKTTEKLRDANPPTPDEVKQEAVAELNRLLEENRALDRDCRRKETSIGKDVAVNYDVSARQLYRWRKSIDIL